MGDSLEKVLEDKEKAYADIRQKIAKLDEQARQVAAQVQKEKDGLLTKGLELQGAIKMLRNELKVTTEADRKAAEEAKNAAEAKTAEVVDQKGPVKLEEKK